MLCSNVIYRVSDKSRNLGKLPPMDLTCFGIGYLDERTKPVREQKPVYIYSKDQSSNANLRHIWPVLELDVALAFSFEF